MALRSSAYELAVRTGQSETTHVTEHVGFRSERNVGEFSVLAQNLFQLKPALLQNSCRGPMVDMTDSFEPLDAEFAHQIHHGVE